MQQDIRTVQHTQLNVQRTVSSDARIISPAQRAHSVPLGSHSFRTSHHYMQPPSDIMRHQMHQQQPTNSDLFIRGTLGVIELFRRR